MDTHRNDVSHLLRFDTCSGNSFFPDQSRPEPEVVILSHDGTQQFVVTGSYGYPISFTLDTVDYGDVPVLAAAKITAFSNSFGSFMLLPSAHSSNTTMTLIMDPIPYNHCSDGNIVHVTTGPDSRELTSGIQLLDSVDIDAPLINVNRQIEISSASEYDYVPNEAYDIVVEAILSAGGRATDDLSSYTNCSASIVAQLPTFVYSFSNHGDVGNSRIDLHMVPQDYVSEIGLGLCMLRLRPSNGTVGILGLNLLSNVAVHFDDDNNQVGFCDPLIVM